MVRPACTSRTQAPKKGKEKENCSEIATEGENGIVKDEKEAKKEKVQAHAAFCVGRHEGGTTLPSS